MTRGERRPSSKPETNAAALGLTVSAPVARQYFRDRITDQYAHHYHLIVSIFKGVALGSAAVSFLAIVGSGAATQAKGTALALWVASMAAIIASYDGIMVGSIMATAPPNAVDLVAPFVMGLAEFMQFALLMPLPGDPSGGQPTTAAQLEHLTWWPLAFGALTLVATVDIRNAKRQIRRAAEEAPVRVQPLMRWYVGSLEESQRLTTISAGVIVVAFVALRLGPDALHRWQVVLALMVLYGMVNSIVTCERARRRIFASVSGVVPPGPRSEPG